jgi:hypothetical protein
MAKGSATSYALDCCLSHSSPARSSHRLRARAASAWPVPGRSIAFCPGVPPGQGRIKACMKEHITQLSAPRFDTPLGAVAAGRK